MTKLTDINGARELPYLDIKDLYDEVCRKAEDKMLKTGKLEGAHYNALKQILAEHGNSTVHLEVDVEAMAKINLNILKAESLKNRNTYVLPEHEYSEFCSCWGCKLSAAIAESISNTIPKWARLVRK